MRFEGTFINIHEDSRYRNIGQKIISSMVEEVKKKNRI